MGNNPLSEGSTFVAYLGSSPNTINCRWVLKWHSIQSRASCFHSSSVVKNSATIMGTQTFIWIPTFYYSRYTPMSGTPGSWSRTLCVISGIGPRALHMPNTCSDHRATPQSLSQGKLFEELHHVFHISSSLSHFHCFIFHQHLLICCPCVYSV